MLMLMTVVVLVLGGIFFLWFILAYNGLVSARNSTEQAWSNVEVELTQRLDLVDNLVETVKGYAKHENETLKQVIAARGQIAAAGSGPAAASAAEGAITTALRGLLAVAEAYPQLKADANFMNLQEQLAAIESRIAAQRKGYNGTAKQYRDLCQTFPSVIVAGLFQFTPKPFYDVPDELVERAPKVKFT